MLMDFLVGDDGFLIDRLEPNLDYPLSDGFIRAEVSEEIYNNWRKYKYVNGEFIHDDTLIIKETKEAEMLMLEKELNEALRDAVEFTYNKEIYYYKCDVESINTLLLYNAYFATNFLYTLTLDVLDSAGYETTIIVDKKTVSSIIESVVLARSDRLTLFDKVRNSLAKATTISEALLDSYEL